MNQPNEKKEIIPVAKIRAKRPWSWLWLPPVIALTVVLALVYWSFGSRGVPITITFKQGYGLKTGDSIQYRGIEIGMVRSVILSDDLKTIAVEAKLHTSAKAAARKGSRFWIVRPRFDISGAAGLDTMIGAKYVNVLPGQGDYETDFTGLDDSPLFEILEPGGLELVLHTPGKGSLRPGAPVSYRQVVVGTIMTVQLARDAGGVEAEVYIKPGYSTLIREKTKFWKASGAKFQAGLTGLSVQLDSIQSLVEGGVKLAVPPDPGMPVEKGRRFILFERPAPQWIAWKPHIDINEGSGTVKERPVPKFAVLKWKSMHLNKTRQGWVLPVSKGLLGPSDVLTPPNEDDFTFTLDGNEASLNKVPEILGCDLVLMPLDHGGATWPDEKRRNATVPEDATIITGEAGTSRFVSAHAFTAENGCWEIDPSIPFAEQWHGACVMADSDGALIGILLVDDDEGKVAFFPGE